MTQTNDYQQVTEISLHIQSLIF